MKAYSSNLKNIFLFNKKYFARMNIQKRIKNTNNQNLPSLSNFNVNKNQEMTKKNDYQNQLNNSNLNISKNESKESKVSKKVDFGKIISLPAKKHIINILNDYEGKNIPLDYHLRKYFNKHKLIPEKDFISNQCYFLMRNKLLLDVISITQAKNEITWEHRYNAYYNKTFFLKQKDNVNIPL